MLSRRSQRHPCRHQLLQTGLLMAVAEGGQGGGGLQRGGGHSLAPLAESSHAPPHCLPPAPPQQPNLQHPPLQLPPITPLPITTWCPGHLPPPQPSDIAQP